MNIHNLSCTSENSVSPVSNNNQAKKHEIVPAAMLRLQHIVKEQAAGKPAVAEKHLEVKGYPEYVGVKSPLMFDGKCQVIENKEGSYLFVPSLGKCVALLKWQNPDYRNGEIKLFRRDDNGLQTICLMHIYTDGSKLVIGNFTVVKDKLRFTSGPALGTKYKGVMLVPKPVKSKEKDAEQAEETHVSASLQKKSA